MKRLRPSFSVRLFLCLLLLALVAPAFAASKRTYQRPFMVEVHMGPAFPSESVGDVDADAGIGYGTSMSYLFMDGLLGVYFDFMFDAYEADSRASPALESLLLMGYGFGMSHQGRLASKNLGYFLRVGAHNSRLYLLDEDGDDLDQSRSAIGFQGSVGINYNLSRDWSLRGGLTYRSYAKRLQRTNVAQEAELEGLALSFGAALRF